MLSGLLVRFLSHRPWLVGTTLTLNTIPEDCDRNGFRSNEHNVCADALSQKQLYLTRTSLRRSWRLQSCSRPSFSASSIESICRLNQYAVGFRIPLSPPCFGVYFQ